MDSTICLMSCLHTELSQFTRVPTSHRNLRYASLGGFDLVHKKNIEKELGNVMLDFVVSFLCPYDLEERNGLFGSIFINYSIKVID